MTIAKMKGRFAKQHHEPGDFAVLIYCEIKDARWEISKQSGYPAR